MNEVRHIGGVINEALIDRFRGNIPDQRETISDAYYDFVDSNYLYFAEWLLEEPVQVNFTEDSVAEVITFSQYADDIKHRLLVEFSNGNDTGISSMYDIIDLLYKENKIPLDVRAFYSNMKDYLRRQNA